MPAKEKAHNHWNAWTVLKRQTEYSHDVSLFKSLFKSQTSINDANELSKVCLSFLHTLKSAWLETVQLLKKEAELVRFETVELPASAVFLDRQMRGMRIDQDELDKRYEALKQEKYQAFIRVARALKVSPSGFNFRNIKGHLNGTELAELANTDDASRIEQNLHLASVNSPLAFDIVSLIRSDRDLKTLSRLSNPAGKCYPTFTTVGTVTGRVLVRNPYLQGLRKRYRSVIAPDEGHSLVYLDYDQFEPGILSSLSQDTALQNLYAKGDIYTQLSETVFDDPRYRSVAKQMFISFLYGMSEQRIIEVLQSGNSNGNDASEVLAEKIKSFFSRFSDALGYRQDMQDLLLANNRINTPLGGHRKRSGAGELNSNERRWALNQRIQGTASLIFKEAMIEIASLLGSQAILLPMHDAFLMQLPIEKLAEQTNAAKLIMEGSMRKYCPTIVPKVSLEKFSQ